MVAPPFPSRTYDPSDLKLPQMAPWARALRAFGVRLGLQGTPFAVNGVLRRRLYVRRHKMWEYAASAACLFAEGEKPLRILDFGGAATLPIYFFAARRCQVACLDIDERLCEATRHAAARHRWSLRVSSENLLESPLPAELSAPFDAVVSASVLEHLPKNQQADAVARLAALIRPGGKFVITFDFGADAPQPGAVRTVGEVERLVAASGLEWIGGHPFRDTRTRFALDRRYPDCQFTFGAMFLERRG
ncbi:MAG TPA: class I SAM-dependent methyltransferase [Candidatus Acidoferrales bacterium]|nr:class I SAM-dependent methyltransferase [Candidatus Acidoferrales bacterium]